MVIKRLDLMILNPSLRSMEKILNGLREINEAISTHANPEGEYILNVSVNRPFHKKFKRRAAGTVNIANLIEELQSLHDAENQP